MTNEVKYGLNVQGKVRVFRKDKDIKGKGKKTFTVTDVWFNVSEQEENGGYFNKSMNLLFKRNIDLPKNNTTIIIENAFPVITGTGNYRKIAFMVTAWREDAGEKVDRGNPFQEGHPKNGEPLDISDDDLPF